MSRATNEPIQPRAGMFTAAEIGTLEEFLVRFDINKINDKKYGSELLHHAISGKCYDTALFLIKNKIDLNMTDEEGNTALHDITLNENPSDLEVISIVRHMLESNIEVNARNRYGNNALWNSMYSSKGRWFEVVKLILNHDGDPDNVNNVDKTPKDWYYWETLPKSWTDKGAR